jgi:hypothetical protein
VPSDQAAFLDWFPRLADIGTRGREPIGEAIHCGGFMATRRGEAHRHHGIHPAAPARHLRLTTRGTAATACGQSRRSSKTCSGWSLHESAGHDLPVLLTSRPARFNDQIVPDGGIDAMMHAKTYDAVIMGMKGPRRVLAENRAEGVNQRLPDVDPVAVRACR